jgi:16S rRNA (uracil1498-N3)-methyltransferase
VHARFHAPDAGHVGQRIALADEEAAHLTRVLRLKPGAVVRLFDGAGHEFLAVVESADRTGAHLRIESVAAAVAEPRVRITLAPAIIKGDKMDDVVRDAVMLGASAVVPVFTERSEVSPAIVARSERRARWQRIAVVSAKQCGRAVVPMVGEPCPLDDLLHGLEAHRHPSPALMFVEPLAAVDAKPLSSVGTPPPAAATVLIGPEGGWTSGEIVRAAERGVALITLRAPTMRADAMPAVALAALLSRWEW